MEQETRPINQSIAFQVIVLLSICTVFLTCCAGHAIVYRKSAYSDLEDSATSSASISPNWNSVFQQRDRHAWDTVQQFDTLQRPFTIRDSARRSMERRSLIIFHDWTGEDNWESGVERWTLSVIGLERRELWFIIFFFQFYDPFFWERERMVLERIVFTYRLDVKYLVFLVISLFSLWKILLKFRFELSNVNIAGHRVSDRDWFTKFRVSNFRVTGVKFDGLLLLKGRRSNYRHS